MQKPISKIARLLVLLAILPVSAACGTGRLRITYQNLQAGAVNSAQVKLNMHRGNLNVAGGAEDLLNAKFTSNVPQWKPEVRYLVNNDTGLLTIQQPDNPAYVLGETTYQWDLKLKKDLPLDLQARVTKGDVDLQLQQMDLTRLDVSTSSGKLTADLPGKYDFSDFTLNTTNGDLQASLTGNFVAPAINLLTSDGKIDTALTGQYNVPILNLQTVNGDIQADLSGKWLSDMQVSVGSESGNILLRLPSDVGVSAVVSTNSGQINADGWKNQDGSYVNDAYGKSNVTIQISAAVVNGDITLQLVK